MKRLAFAIAVALGIQAGGAFAQPGEGPGQGRGQGPRELRGAPPGREMRPDDGQRHEHRRREVERRQERMTPEERDTLRRDIRDHGRDVYRPRGR